jgi:hypothetical protein
MKNFSFPFFSDFKMYPTPPTTPTIEPFIWPAPIRVDLMLERPTVTADDWMEWILFDGAHPHPDHNQ